MQILCRLQPHQKMNGGEKNLEQGEEKQFTCSFIIGTLWHFHCQWGLHPMSSKYLYILDFNLCICSRNTAQKQWDETLVLVLNGVSRILRSFFPFLRSLSNFWSGKVIINQIIVSLVMISNGSWYLEVLFPNCSLIWVILRGLIITGWESLLIIVKDSILNGSKEVALAAVSSLQTTIVSHSLKVIINSPI